MDMAFIFVLGLRRMSMGERDTGCCNLYLSRSREEAVLYCEIILRRGEESGGDSRELQPTVRPLEQ